MDITSIDRDNVLAAVKFGGELRFYAARLPVWIMDCDLYTSRSIARQPEIDNASESSVQSDWIFRGGLNVVDDKNARDFCTYIRRYEVSLTDIKAILDGDLLATTWLLVLIDFDKRLFVDGTFSDDLCRFVPPGWECVEDHPEYHLPRELNVWPTSIELTD